MAESFDAYHAWLGIAPKDQPPNHYRLLGVDLFDDWPDTTEHAADQRMAHLCTFQTGPHSALSQRLLNEMAAARLCGTIHPMDAAERWHAVAGMKKGASPCPRPPRR